MRWPLTRANPRRACRTTARAPRSRGAVSRRMGRLVDLYLILPLYRTQVIGKIRKLMAEKSFSGFAAHFSMASHCEQLRRGAQWEAALRCYASLESPRASDSFHAAICSRELGRTAEAAAHYERAIELKPRFAEAYMNAGWVLWEDSRPAEAIAGARVCMPVCVCTSAPLALVPPCEQRSLSTVPDDVPRTTSGAA